MTKTQKLEAQVENLKKELQERQDVLDAKIALIRFIKTELGEDPYRAIGEDEFGELLGKLKGYKRRYLLVAEQMLDDAVDFKESSFSDYYMFGMKMMKNHMGIYKSQEK